MRFKFIPGFVFLVAIHCLTGFSDAATFKRFYNEPASYKFPKKRITIKPKRGRDDERIQAAIDSVANANGGIVTINPGKYSIGRLEMKSNVHIRVHANVTIVPALASGINRAVIFGFGRLPFQNSVTVSNASVRNFGKNTRKNGNRFVIAVPKNLAGEDFRVSAADFNDTSNFLFTGMQMLDRRTFLNAMTTAQHPKSKKGPRNGDIRNCQVNNSSPGYGLIQVQAGNNISFENLSGIGGVTLRLETGNSSPLVGTLNNLFARNIRCTNGRSAVFLQPHAATHGSVQITKVVAKSCSYAVEAAPGFVRASENSQGIKPGTFNGPINIDGITSTFGLKAHVERNQLFRVPASQKEFIQGTVVPGGVAVLGPSIAPVRYDSIQGGKDSFGNDRKPYTVKFGTIKRIGGYANPNILRP